MEEGSSEIKVNESESRDLDLVKLQKSYLEFRESNNELLAELFKEGEKVDEKVRIKAELIVFGAWMCKEDLKAHRAKVELPKISFDQKGVTKVAATNKEGGIVINADGLSEDAINSTTKLKIFDGVKSFDMGLSIDDGAAMKYIMVGVEEFGHWFFMQSKSEETVKSAESEYKLLSAFSSFAQRPDLVMHVPRFEYESLMIQDWFIRNHLTKFSESFGNYVGQVMGEKFRGRKIGRQ